MNNLDKNYCLLNCNFNDVLKPFFIKLSFQELENPCCLAFNYSIEYFNEVLHFVNSFVLFLCRLSLFLQLHLPR